MAGIVREFWILYRRRSDADPWELFAMDRRHPRNQHSPIVLFDDYDEGSIVEAIEREAGYQTWLVTYAAQVIGLSPDEYEANSGG